MPILRGVVEFFWNNPIFKWQLKPIKIMYKCWLFQEFGRETRKTCSIIWFISFINFCSNHVSVVNYSIEAEILIILSCICNLFYRKLHVYLLHVIWSPCGSWLVRRNHQIMCSFLLIHRCRHDFFWYTFLFFVSHRNPGGKIIMDCSKRKWKNVWERVRNNKSNGFKVVSNYQAACYCQVLYMYLNKSFYKSSTSSTYRHCI